MNREYDLASMFSMAVITIQRGRTGYFQYGFIYEDLKEPPVRLAQIVRYVELSQIKEKVGMLFVSPVEKEASWVRYTMNLQIEPPPSFYDLQKVAEIGKRVNIFTTALKKIPFTTLQISFLNAIDEYVDAIQKKRDERPGCANFFSLDKARFSKARLLRAALNDSQSINDLVFFLKRCRNSAKSQRSLATYVGKAMYRVIAAQFTAISCPLEADFFNTNLYPKDKRVIPRNGYTSFHALIEHAIQQLSLNVKHVEAIFPNRPSVAIQL